MAKNPQYLIPDPDLSKFPKSYKIPPVKGAKSDEKCKFSFAHWSQIKNFGLDCERVDITWIVALLDQLKILSDHTIEELTTDRKLGKALRYHPIDWNGSGTTMSKEDAWKLIPEGYRSDEYEIAQFQITMSKGRIIGFFDHEWVFRIVLLDPMHNMILAKESHHANYRVRNTADLLTPYQKLENQMLALKARIGDVCPEKKCEIEDGIHDALRVSNENVFICLEDYCDSKVLELLGEKYTSLDDLILEAFDLLHQKHFSNDSTN